MKKKNKIIPISIILVVALFVFISFTSGVEIYKSPTSKLIHNQLSGLQGGSIGEYFHFNETLYDYILANYSNITADFSETDPLWTSNYTAYNDSWSSTYNSSYLLNTGDTATGDYNFSNTLFVDDSAKKVGVGTTSPVRDLHIAGTIPRIRLSDTDATTDIEVTGYYEFYRGLNTNRVGYFGFGSSGSKHMSFVNQIPGGAITFLTDNIQRMIIYSGGNANIDGTTFNVKALTNSVGFGKSNPGYPIDSIGDVRHAGATDMMFWDSSANSLGINADTTPNAYLHIGQNSNQNRGILFSFTNNDYRNSISNGMSNSVDADNYMKFEICDKTTTGTSEVMRLRGDGFVGIGTTSPLSLLHLSDTTYPQLRIHSEDGGNYSGIRTKAFSGGNALHIDLKTIATGDETGRWGIWMGAVTEKFTIFSNGSVDIVDDLTAEFITAEKDSRTRSVRSTLQNISGTSKVIWNGGVFDTLSEINVTGSWVAKNTGYYFVNSMVTYNSVAWAEDEVRILSLYKNGVLDSALFRDKTDKAQTGVLNMQGSGLVYLEVGDYIEIYVTDNLPSSAQIGNAGGQYNYLQVHRLS